jgi:hypothetical protein
MRLKTTRSPDEQEVKYDPARWKTLALIRERSALLACALGPQGAHLYGSAARGDVRPSSDVDLVLLEGARPFEAEVALEAARIDILSREVVMATPNSPAKAHFVIDDKTTVTVPLVPLRDREEEFYRFGGMISASDAESRVPGVDKRLVLVSPIRDGHLESPVRGREAEVARLLRISVETVEERVRVLDRRDEVGRTGVYLRSEVPEGEGVERFFSRLADRDPVLRRMVKQRTR